eukprot:SAG25_NODE_1089_length_4047_cov_2.337386_2_plen_163_part_00
MDAAATTIQRAYRAMIAHRCAHPSGGALQHHGTVDQFTDGIMQAAAGDVHREHQRALSYKCKLMLTIRKLNRLKTQHQRTKQHIEYAQTPIMVHLAEKLGQYLDYKHEDGKPLPDPQDCQDYLNTFFSGLVDLYEGREWVVRYALQTFLNEHGHTANDPIVL